MARQHKTFVSLGEAVKKYGATVEERANFAKIELAKDIAYGVINLTPVDTGRARSNWIAKIGSPASHTRKPFVPGIHLGRTERANLGASYAAANANRGRAPKAGSPSR